MPRIAIKDYDTSFFHIMVQGIIKKCTNRFKEINLLYIDKIYEEVEIDYSYMNQRSVPWSESLQKFNIKYWQLCKQVVKYILYLYKGEILNEK